MSFSKFFDYYGNKYSLLSLLIGSVSKGGCSDTFILSLSIYIKTLNKIFPLVINNFGVSRVGIDEKVLLFSLTVANLGNSSAATIC